MSVILFCAKYDTSDLSILNSTFPESFFIIPVIVFIIPYVYELYVINNCNYLLKYNYQNGIIQSDDTYIAIINNKPVTITLQKNLFNRKGFSNVYIWEYAALVTFPYKNMLVYNKENI